VCRRIAAAAAGVAVGVAAGDAGGPESKESADDGAAERRRAERGLAALGSDWRERASIAAAAAAAVADVADVASGIGQTWGETAWVEAACTEIAWGVREMESAGAGLEQRMAVIVWAERAWLLRPHPDSSSCAC